MARPLRKIAPDGLYHVLNRGNHRQTLFHKPPDYQAFLKILHQALERFPVDLLAYTLMSNHWHLLLRPRTAPALSQCLAWITLTHSRRHHAHYPDFGPGHLYQGRFKSFPIQTDEHFLTVARYIHANPLRAQLVRRAQDWPWSDIAIRSPLHDPVHTPRVSSWPLDRPHDWLNLVNQPLDAPTLAQIQTSIRRGTPFGTARWKTRIANRLLLTSTLRPLGRPPRPISSLSPRQKQRRSQHEAGQNRT